MMKRTFEDDDEFSFNMSAFLSAARSITWHMQKQYAGHGVFDEWYSQKQAEISSDPELKYLNELRVEEVHREPVQTGATRQVSYGISAVFGKDTAPDGQTKGAEPKADARSVGPKTVRRFLPEFGNMEVLEFCENQLAKLNRLVKECERQFL